MYNMETYNKLYETSMLLEKYYDIDKVKSWAVFVWDKKDDKNSDCGLFDILENEIIFYTDNHTIIEEAKPIIKQIQKLLKEVRKSVDMRDPKRIKPFLDKLGTIWEENCPDWRFDQLMMNVFGAMEQDPFFPEEDEMIEFFENYFK